MVQLDYVRQQPISLGIHSLTDFSVCYTNKTFIQPEDFELESIQKTDRTTQGY